MLPLQLTGKAINNMSFIPFATTTASITIAKSFSNAAKPTIRRPRISTMSTAACSRQRPSYIAPQQQQQQLQLRFLSSSSFRNTKNGKSANVGANANSTLSTLSNIFAAGIGTFASTLAALYLATIVETSAHEFLYEYFPHWYGDVPTESLPHCLLNRELARRVTGVFVLNRARGVGTAEGASSEESMMLMGMDGWIEQPGSRRQLGVSALPPLSLAAATAAAWEKTMMDNRARIIENEEKEFSRGFLSSTSSTATSLSSHKDPGNNNNNNNNKRMIVSGMNTNRFMEKVQVEATRKFQEQLASVAMTA